jgi:Asp-tRNA(Asn)/Glu-tRNA(Gln) amidotransferase A subunit family amidase
MTDLHYLTAAKALRLFRARDLSPVELVSAVIKRAEDVEPVINDFAETFYEQALDQARAAEARYAGRTSADWMDVLMTLPFNIASRCPVMSVPSGLSRDGVPTGLSIVGKTYDDVTVFRIAAAHEERLPWLDAPARGPAL